MKISKRILSVILALAVLLVSLPLTMMATAADLPDALAGLAEGKTLLSYDFSEYDAGSLPDGFIYGASSAEEGPKLSWGYGNPDGGTAGSWASIQAVGGKNYLVYKSALADSVLLAPAITETNYVYEATFVMVTANSNVGVANLAWGDTIADVKGAQWIGVRNDSDPVLWGKGTSGITSVTGFSTYRPAAGDTITMKLISYEGTNYYFINGEYVTSIAQKTSGDGTGGRVGFYTYGGTLNISSLSVKKIGQPETVKIWNGSFDGKFPTTDADGDGEIEINTPEEFAAVMKTGGTFKKITNRIVNKTIEYRWWGETINSITDDVIVDEGFEAYIPYAVADTVVTANTEKELERWKYTASDGKEYDKATKEITTTYTTTYRIKYELTGDIFLNDTRVEGWKDNNPNHWLDPIKAADVSADNTFYGIINGNGYVVRGVYVDKVYAEGEISRTEFTDPEYVKGDVLTSGTELVLYEEVYAGLIPVLGKGGAIVALGMEDSYISVRDSSEPIVLKKDGSSKAMDLIGSVGLVGVVANSGKGQAIIDQCYINESVELKGGRVALVGCGNKTPDFTVSNCYASAAITRFVGTSGTGWDNNSQNRFMLVSGNGSRPTIYSSYTFGNVVNNGVFNKNITPANNVYYYSGWSNPAYATSVEANVILGENAVKLMPNLDWSKFETVTGARPVLKVFTTHAIGTDGAVWNGSIDSDLKTDSDGYKLITNAAELRYAVTASGNFRLANDIWVNSLYVNAEGGFYLADGAPKTWVESGSFGGTFDGNGKVVRGLFYNVPDAVLVYTESPYSGLIPTLKSGNTVVKRVGVEQSYFRNHGTGTMGAVVATLDASSGCTIDTCYAGESVYLNGCQKVGGITGGRDNTAPRYIRNCYSLATIKADVGVFGGIAGDAWNKQNLVIDNCYTTSTQLVGGGDYVVGTNCYITGSDKGATEISLDKMMGADALTNMAGLNTDGVYVTTARYPTFKIFDPNYVEEEEVGEVWNGSIAASYAGGSGTEADPYIISKGSQLARAINNFGENGAYFKLDRDIYLNDISKANWTDSARSWFTGNAGSDSDGYTYNSYNNRVSETALDGGKGIFYGNIDGAGHTVYGLYYSSGLSSYGASLIPAISGGTYKNLGVDYASVSATDTAAALFAFSNKYKSAILIDNCYVGENVKVSAGDAKGGILGYANGDNGAAKAITIKNSYVLIPTSALGTSVKTCAFIAETWNTTYYMENCYSIAQPFSTGGMKARASKAYQDDLSKIPSVIKNVFCLEDSAVVIDAYESYEEDGKTIGAFTMLSAGEMRGTAVFEKMTINGDGAFIYNIGYPSLKWQGNIVPNESELLQGLQNIGTLNDIDHFTVPTTTFVYKTTFTAGNSESLQIGDNYRFEVVGKDNTVMLVGEELVSKQLELSGEVEVKLYAVGGFLIAYLNGEYFGFVSVNLEANSEFAKLGENNATIDLYIPEASFDGVSVGKVDLQLKDALGNAMGGVKFDVTLKQSSAINSLGYPTEYGVLYTIGDKINDDLTAELANKFALTGDKTFEITGLGTAKQELFFSLRGYAKITVGQVEYYYYGKETTVFSPIYEANDLYENETYAEVIKAAYGASDKFIENLTQDIEFAAFGDYHYNSGQYTSQLSDLKAIMDKAKTLRNGQGADFVLSLGDFTNNMLGSKEVTNYALDGKYSFRGTELEDDHSFAFYNLYGNHELESSNTLTYVNTTLTNSEVHWGDGSVGSVAEVTQKYAGQSVGNNEFDKRNELVKGSYYWFENNGFRIIVVNTNFSWNPNHINGEVVGWEHSLIGSYGSPLASHNASRGFDEGTAAAANTKGYSLGPVQLEWLESVLMEAVEEGTPCIVAAHGSFANEIGAGGDSAQVRALYKKANDIRTGTVLASINGDKHTNRQVVVENVLYLDITTVRNSEWRSTSEPHYASEHTFTYDYYDDNGNWLRSETKGLNSLSMGKNTWFANDPVSSSIKITAKGNVELTGMKTKYMYDVIPEGYKDYGYPGQNSGYWNIGDSSFTVTEYAYPQR